MIIDLDKSLEALLRRELTGVGVSFDPPDGKFAPALPCADLFLYDIRENRDLRVNERAVTAGTPHSITTQRPPVRVDCSYLITAWASDAQNEHLLLSQIIKVLFRYPTLPPDVLQGGLVGQQPPLPTTALQPNLLQSMGEFWQAMGGRPKAALSYTVTIGMPVFDPVEVPKVIERVTTIRQVN